MRRERESIDELIAGLERGLARVAVSDTAPVTALLVLDNPASRAELRRDFLPRRRHPSSEWSAIRPYDRNAHAIFAGPTTRDYDDCLRGPGDNLLISGASIQILTRLTLSFLASRS